MVVKIKKDDVKKVQIQGKQNKGPNIGFLESFSVFLLGLAHYSSSSIGWNLVFILQLVNKATIMELDITKSSRAIKAFLHG